MQNIYRFSGIMAVVFLVSVSYADIPRLITYQGIFTDSVGTPLTDGTFEYQLGSAVALLSIFDGDSLVYLGIIVDDETGGFGGLESPGGAALFYLL